MLKTSGNPTTTGRQHQKEHHGQATSGVLANRGTPETTDIRVLLKITPETTDIRVLLKITPETTDIRVLLKITPETTDIRVLLKITLPLPRIMNYDMIPSK